MEGSTVAVHAVSAKIADFREVSCTARKLGHRYFTDIDPYSWAASCTAHLTRFGMSTADVIAFTRARWFETVLTALGLLRRHAGHAPVNATLTQFWMGFAVGDILANRSTLLDHRLTPEYTSPGRFALSKPLVL